MRILRNLLVASTMLMAGSAVAQDAASVDTLLRRDTLLPPVLAWLQQQGNKLTLIGEEAGLKGYLLESPTGKLQSVYVAPDGKHVILGLLYQQGGKNVTGVQLGEMRQRFDSAAKALASKVENSSAADAVDAMKQGHLDTATPETGPAETKAASPDAAAIPDQVVSPGGVSGVPVQAPAVDATPVDLVPEVKGEAPALVAPSATTLAEAQPISVPEATSAIAGADGNPSDVWASEIDRDQFLKAAEATPFFEVGSVIAPVTLWMVADPKCPYCHAAWDYLEPLVFDKKIKVKVILINALEGSEPFSRELLASPAPGRRWIESKAGTNLEPKVDPNSKEWKDAEKYLAMNMEFAKSFGINRTPFLAYVSPDGRFYSVLGVPSDLDSFLAASGVKSK
jgi:protein-disulfide isomerase